MSTAATQPAAAPTGERGAFTPIAEYGLLADCNSAALVDRDGSIDWLCLPRYDRDAIFARLLDPDAGHWSIRPAGEYTRRAPLPPGHARHRDDVHDRRRRRAAARRDGVRRRASAVTTSATTRRTRCCAAVEGVVGRGRARDGARAAARVRAHPAADPRAWTGGARTFGGPNRIEVALVRAARAARRRRCTRRFAVRAGERARVRDALGAARATATRPADAAAERAPRGSTTSSRRGARGRPSTTSTPARTASSCATARAC